MLFFTMKEFDIITFGQRLRHLRRARGLTLGELGDRVGKAPSVLSLLENGKREPKLSLIEELASALSVPVSELVSHQPPTRRAQLEIAVAQAQQDPSYRRLGLPTLKIGARVPTDVLEHLAAVAAALRAQESRPAATPEDARAANAALRETHEEVGMRVALGPLLGVFNDSAITVVVYLATPGKEPPSLSVEATEVHYFAPEDVPWHDLAFPTTTDALTAWVALERSHSARS